MSDKLPGGGDRSSEQDFPVADDYRLQIASNGNCVLVFIRDGREFARIGIPSGMADSMAETLKPEVRRQLWEQAREDFLQRRH